MPTRKKASSTRSSSTRSSSARSSSAKARSAKSASSKSSASRSSGSRSTASSKTTTNHRAIIRWAEDRGGKPSCVIGTGGRGDTGLLRIDFPGYSGKGKLKEITWDEFFTKFDEEGLALLYQDQTRDGRPSNFNKLVNRPGRGGDEGESGGAKKKSAGRHGRRGGSSR